MNSGRTIASTVLKVSVLAALVGVGVAGTPQSAKADDSAQSCLCNDLRCASDLWRYCCNWDSNGHLTGCGCTIALWGCAQT